MLIPTTDAARVLLYEQYVGRIFVWASACPRPAPRRRREEPLPDLDWLLGVVTLSSRPTWRLRTASQSVAEATRLGFC